MEAMVFLGNYLIYMPVGIRLTSTRLECTDGGILVYSSEKR